MKTNRTRLWYLGYAACAVLLLLIAFADFPRSVDIGLACAFGAVRADFLPAGQRSIQESKQLWETS